MLIVRALQIMGDLNVVVEHARKLDAWGNPPNEGRLVLASQRFDVTGAIGAHDLPQMLGGWAEGMECAVAEQGGWHQFF